MNARGNGAGIDRQDQFDEGKRVRRGRRREAGAREGERLVGLGANQLCLRATRRGQDNHDGRIACLDARTCRQQLSHPGGIAGRARSDQRLVARIARGRCGSRCEDEPQAS